MKNKATFKTIMIQMSMRVVPCAKICLKKRGSAKSFNLLMNGVGKFYAECDVVNLLRAVRMMKVFMLAGLDQR